MLPFVLGIQMLVKLDMLETIRPVRTRRTLIFMVHDPFALFVKGQFYHILNICKSKLYIHTTNEYFTSVSTFLACIKNIILSFSSLNLDWLSGFDCVCVCVFVNNSTS